MTPLQRLHLEWCHACAATRGGACLSARFDASHAKLDWRCALGHGWKAGASQILNLGTWCPTCGHERRARRTRATSFTAARAAAEKQGGSCLSASYERSGAKLEFRCAEGHQWSTTPSQIVQGTWCRRCRGVEANRATTVRKFKSLKAYAKRRGGECLATTYVNVWAKLRWRCAEGHVWEAASKQVGDGAWCPRCAGVEKHTLEELQGWAAAHGGQCLSEVYVDAAHPVRWRCTAGHEWSATASNVIHQGNWCPRCYGAPRDQLERLKRIAKRRRGECLSPEYLGSEAHHHWRCREGHEWWTKARSVVHGSWCPTCREGATPRTDWTLEDMIALAEERGGECRSKQFFNMGTHLWWRCARGHEWEAIPSAVRRGTWCRVCSVSVRGTLDGLRQRARELGGRCASLVYDDPRVPLDWQCAKGHRFKALAKAVKSGVWCPKCSRRPTEPAPRRTRRRDRPRPRA